MADAGHDYAFVVRESPRQDLLRSGLLLLVVVPLPIFGVLLFLGIPNGTWPIAVVGEAVLLLLCIPAVILFRSIFVGVTATSIVERGMSGRRRFSPVAEVQSVVLAQTYNASSADTVAQLIVRDGQNGRMLRLRGVFWTEDSMRTIAAALPSPLEAPVEPFTADEFFTRYPGSAYWFENRPVVAAITLALILAACAALAVALIRLVGLPVSG